LVLGQNPYAGILSCADSRIAPKHGSDTGRGNVFVWRVAGNFAGTGSLASFEYAMTVLSTPLILVRGHNNCGAVTSTGKAVKVGQTFPGHIPSLISAIRPAVNAALHGSGDLLENAIRQNDLLNVKKGSLRVVGGIYDLSTGTVTLIV